MNDHCRETLERAYLILDGEEVDDAERAEIVAHLEECGPCLDRYGLEKHVKGLMTRLRGTTRCPAELRRRITFLIDQG